VFLFRLFHSRCTGDGTGGLMRNILLAIPCWIAYQLFIFLPLLLAGWIIVPVAALCKAYEKTDDNLSKPNDGPIYHFTWSFMSLWDNYEDGIANQNYVKFKSQFMRIVYWSCVRNPVNGLRISPTFSCKIVPEKVRFIGSITNKTWYGKAYPATPSIDWEKATRTYDTKIPQWFFCWQTIWHSNFYWQFRAMGKLWRFWIGNAKIYPTDIYGGPYGYRELGSGPVAQFKRVKT
jgi:hypothetical protein